MVKENYIGTQNLKNEIENLIVNTDIVFIEFEYYTVLEKMMKVLDELNYSTNLFKAEWDKWNYSDPDNLIQLKNYLISNPNENYYLEINTKEKSYTCCNLWSKNYTLNKKNLKITCASTLNPNFK